MEKLFTFYFFLDFLEDGLLVL